MITSSEQGSDAAQPAAALVGSTNGLLSPYRGDLVLSLLNNAVSLATVFLIVKLGWRHAVSFGDNPLPMLMALLCFFHIIVYWLNLLHLLKFAETRYFSTSQTWTLAFFALGLVFYPISLDAWLEARSLTLYVLINCYLCALLNVWVLVSPVAAGGNAVFRGYRRLGPPLALCWYLVVLALLQHGVRAHWMLWLAPFLFAVPLGAAERAARPGDGIMRLSRAGQQALAGRPERDRPRG